MPQKCPPPPERRGAPPGSQRSPRGLRHCGKHRASFRHTPGDLIRDEKKRHGKKKKNDEQQRCLAVRSRQQSSDAFKGSPHSLRWVLTFIVPNQSSPRTNISEWRTVPCTIDVCKTKVSRMHPGDPNIAVPCCAILFRKDCLQMQKGSSNNQTM